MKAIKTTYHGPGNIKGSRIIATDDDGNRRILPYDYALNREQNHSKAAYALRDKMGWTGELITGCLKDCYVHVFTS
jgi:hypothetical protein